MVVAHLFHKMKKIQARDRGMVARRMHWQAYRRSRKVNKMVIVNPTQPRFHMKFEYGAGLDVHNLYVTACIVVKQEYKTERLKVQEFRRTPGGLGNMCRFLGKYLISIVVMEATGQTPSVLDALEAFDGWGGIVPELVVINPSLIKKFPGELHHDKHDAAALARLGLAGLAKGSYIPLDEVRQLRSITREVSNLVHDTTQVKNRIKRILSHWGLPLMKFQLHAGWAVDLVKHLITNEGDFGKTILAILDGSILVRKTTINAIKRREGQFKQFYPVIIPQSIIESIHLYMLELSFTAAILARLVTKIEGFVNAHPLLLRQIRLIQDIPGLSERSATGIIAEVGNIHRFPAVRSFLKYVGCTSSQFQSGNMDYKGKLAKRVNHHARNYFITAGRVLVNAIKKESDLKEYARKMVNAHHGEKKLIFTNTGIKIAKTVYGVLKNGKPYAPFHESGRDQGIEKSANEPPIKTKVFKMSQFKSKTNALVKYIKKTVEENPDPLYQELADFFHELQGNPRKKEEEDAHK
jgi:transposase